MQASLNRLLLALALGVVVLDIAWLSLGHFVIDARNYAILFALAALLCGLSSYYGRVRNEEVISALLGNTSFLIVFPAGAALTSYLLVTIAGPRIDAPLAALDQALGFHWPSLMAWAADHRWLNAGLALAYTSVMPQTVILTLVLAFQRQIGALYGFSLALAIGAIVTLGVWTAFPSFGAFSVFTLPNPVAAKLGMVLGFDYARDLVAMLKDGPGFISPTNLRGVVGFPSYHTLQALVLIWYARDVRWLRWPALVLNLGVLVAVPIEGGHHLVDMAGGLAVTVLAVALADGAVRRAAAKPVPAPLAPAAILAR